MARSLTAGLPGPNGGSTGYVAQPLRREGKLLAQRARCDSGTTYEQIAAATARSLQVVWDVMNVNDKRRQLSYSDLLALSRHSQTKTFVAHLLEPIVANTQPKPPTDGK